MSEFWLWFFAIIGIISCVLALLLILASLMPPETESPSDEKIAQKQKEALDTIEILGRQGDEKFAARDWQAAISIYKRVIELCRNVELKEVEKTSYDLCGISAMHLGNFEVAIFYFSKGTKEDAYLYNRAIAHYSFDNYLECIEDCIQVSRENGSYAPSFWLRGLARLEIGDRTMAINDFKKAVELDKKHGNDYGEDHHSYYFRALAYIFVNQKQKAKLDIEQALKWAGEVKDTFYEAKIHELQKKLNSQVLRGDSK